MVGKTETIEKFTLSDQEILAISHVGAGYRTAAVRGRCAIANHERNERVTILVVPVFINIQIVKRPFPGTFIHQFQTLPFLFISLINL